MGMGMVYQASIPHYTCSYFTGAIYTHGSSVVLRGKTIFANNTADLGGKTVKLALL